MPTHDNDKNETSQEMKTFNPSSNFTGSQALRGDAQKCPFSRSQHSFCHTNNGCLFEAWGLIFIQKRRKKRAKCLFLYLELSTTLQVGTSIIQSDMWVKQGKRLYKFLQKYTDYGTETSQLAGYNIIVLNMEKYFCGPASTFHRGNQKSDIA